MKRQLSLLIRNLLVLTCSAVLFFTGCAVEYSPAATVADPPNDAQTTAEDPLPVQDPSIFSRVADYENHFTVWGQIPGSSRENKLDFMNVDLGSNQDDAFSLTGHLCRDTYEDAEQIVDTLTYFYEIVQGYEKATFEDAPYLIPYLVENPLGAIIILPGGGYVYKSMDGGTGESKDVALLCNEAGYDAFVLHYRSNPYEYPLPQLDVQRSVRFIRHFADDYGFPANNIGLIGFSAGAYQTGSYINLVMGNNLFPDSYMPDEIDAEDDTVQHAAMIYPLLDFYHNVPMLFALFDADDLRNEDIRTQILKDTDLSENFRSASVRQFVSYGTADSVVGTETALRYEQAALAVGCDLTMHVATDYGHAYHYSVYEEAYTAWLKEAPDVQP